MKELDFLPGWYRANRQRKQCRYRHYVLFGLVVALLAGWSFLAGHSVSALQAETEHIELTLQKGQKTIQQALDIEMEIAQLNRQTDILAVLTPRTAISAVLGELSQQVSENIILGRILLVQQPIADKKAASPSSVRLAVSKDDSPSLLPEGPLCTRVVLTGIASDGEQVARLIDRLETSDYFKNVAPAFSRAKKIGDKEVAEFEITCQVADYKLLGNK